MRTILLLVTLLPAIFASDFLRKENFQQTAPVASNSTIGDVKDFFIGVMIAMKASDKVPDAFQCISAVSKAEPQIKEVIALMNNGSVTQAALIILSLYSEVGPSCEKMIQEGKAYGQDLAGVFEDQTKYEAAIQRITSNPGLIIDDIAKGMNDIRNKSYFNAGVDFGGIPATFFFGGNSTAME